MVASVEVGEEITLVLILVLLKCGVPKVVSNSLELRGQIIQNPPSPHICLLNIVKSFVHLPHYFVHILGVSDFIALPPHLGKLKFGLLWGDCLSEAC